MIDYSICSLYSGSSGNAFLIRTQNANILIDAGKSAKALCEALNSVGVDPDSLNAIFITHEHNDHISALQTFSHKHSVPIYIIYKSATKFASCNDRALCECLNVRKKAGFSEIIGNVTVTSFPTHHDSMASCGYRFDISDGGGRVSIGYLTDCGYISPDIQESLIGCESVVLESNHDIEMLMTGPYPYELKLRIRSNGGHLSNADCAELAAKLCESGTKNIMLAHISEHNNIPDLALGEVRGCVGGDTNLTAAAPDRPVWFIKNGRFFDADA